MESYKDGAVMHLNVFSGITMSESGLACLMNANKIEIKHKAKMKVI